MIILSAHDTLIAMILSALELQQDEPPPFATTLIFELWTLDDGTKLVKLLYNDKELDLHSFCYDLPSNSSINQLLSCDFKTFKERILFGTYPDTKLQCQRDEDPLMSMSGVNPDYLIIGAIIGVVLLSLLVFWFCYTREGRFEVKVNKQRDRFELVEEAPNKFVPSHPEDQ